MSFESDATPINFAELLNPQQLAAVTSPFGPALVLAGAGSGKTRTLTYRVAYLLEQGVNPGRIMLLTFTNKAAKEMLGRVQELTGIEAHRFWGGTFHHIGLKLLRMNAEALKISPSFTVLDQSEAESVLNEAIKAAEPGFLRDKGNPKPAIIANIISFARNTLKPVTEVIRARYPYLEDKIDPISRFFDRYTLLKRTRGVCDYDDLLELWLKLLTDHPTMAAELGNRFEHLLVDEYQDTNPLQSAIIDRMAPHHRIMAVGDDAQCIYTWRGADVDNILSFPERHAGTQIYKIELNYRSTPPILTLANTVLASTRKEFEKTLMPVRSGSAKPAIVPVMDGRAQATYVVRKIRELQAQGRSLSEIIVLYRAHFHAMELQLELTRLCIPFAITSGMRFFEQSHVKDLVTQLRFAFNPKDASAFVRFACLLPKVGEVTALKIHGDIVARHCQQGMTLEAALADPAVVARIPADAKDEWKEVCDTLVELAKALADNESPAAVTHRALEGWYSGFIRTIYPNWDSRLEDLASLESFAQRFESFAEYLSQLVLLNAEATDHSVEAPADALKLSTVHQAKGLEFPSVIVIGLAEGMFPGRRAIEEGTLDEERRLFYVAVTRAMDDLTLIYPLLGGNNFVQQTPSRFLEALPSDTFELIKTASQGATGGFGNSWGKGGTSSGTGSKQSSYAAYRPASQQMSRGATAGGFSSAGRASNPDDPFGNSRPASKDVAAKTEANAKKLFNW